MIDDLTWSPVSSLFLHMCCLPEVQRFSNLMLYIKKLNSYGEICRHAQLVLIVWPLVLGKPGFWKRSSFSFLAYKTCRHFSNKLSVSRLRFLEQSVSLKILGQLNFVSSKTWVEPFHYLPPFNFFWAKKKTKTRTIAVREKTVV